MVILEDIIEGAKDIANFEGTGDSDEDFVALSMWVRWANDAIEAFFKKVMIWNPAALHRFVDFTLTAGQSTYAWLPDVRVFKGLSLDPGLSRKRTVHKMNFGARDRQGDRHYDVQGRNVVIEPAINAAGNYRMFYDGGPTKLAPALMTDVTVRAASAADLSVANPAAVWGVSQGDVNTVFMDTGGGAGGALLVDGVTIGANGIAGDTILVRHGAVAVTPTFFATLVATGPLPGTVVYTPGPVFGTSLRRLSSDPGYTLLVVDGVTPSEDDTILVVGQANANQNGLYRVDENDAGVWSLIRVALGDPPVVTVAEYNAAFAVAAARVAVTGGSAGFNTTWRLTSGVGVDVAPITFARGIVPGKGLWRCGGRGEDGHLYFGRMSQARDDASVPKGFLATPTEGAANAAVIFSSLGDADTIGTWLVGFSNVTFDPASSTNVLDEFFEPFLEWVETRMAVRAIAKNSDAVADLNGRLVELTDEARQYIVKIDAAESDAANDLSLDDTFCGLDPRLFQV